MVENSEKFWFMLHPYKNSTKKLLSLVPAVVFSGPCIIIHDTNKAQSAEHKRTKAAKQPL